MTTQQWVGVGDEWSRLFHFFFQIYSNLLLLLIMFLPHLHINCTFHLVSFSFSFRFYFVLFQLIFRSLTSVYFVLRCMQNFWQISGFSLVSQLFYLVTVFLCSRCCCCCFPKVSFHIQLPLHMTLQTYQ